MSDALSQAGLAISGMLFAGLWEGAIIVAAVWLFLRVSPRLGASTRYATWLSVLLMLVVAPLCTIAISGQHRTPRLVTPVNAVAVTDMNAPAEHPAIAALQSTRQSHRTPQLLSLPSQQHVYVDIPLDLSVAIAVLWLLVTGARIAYLVVNLRGLSRLRRSAEALRVAHGYTVLASRRTSVPLAIGFIHPAVVLPWSVNEELSVEVIDAIVMHEVAHLRRCDVWTNALARVLESLLTLNPFTWLVMARLSVEREIACDDWVVARLDAGEAFANALANMAFRRPFTSIAAPSAIGPRHAVVARIERLLDRRPRRLRLSAVALTSILLLLTLFAAIVPAVSPVLAFTPQAPAQAIAAGCADHPALMEAFGTSLRPTGRWVPLTYDPGKANNPKNTVADLTIDAKGKLSKMVVISTPHARDGKAARWLFAHVNYRPAVVNCKAIGSTVRIAGLIDIAPPAPISIVRANYPNGWSSEHPGACRVPDLTHGGVPSVRLVNNKTVTASVVVRVDTSGRVVDAALSKSSGNTSYDEATLAAARADTYPLDERNGFKPVRPSGAPLSWNAAHGYSLYSKCTPLPSLYTWTTTFPPADT